MKSSNVRVALVHDFLREYGGAERVLEAFHELYPKAPVYVAFYDPQSLGSHAQRFAGWDIRQTVLSRFPFIKRLFSPYRIFSAWAFQRLDLSQYDLVISSTNMYMAKAVRVAPGAKHISYIHTPPRSLYGLSTMTDWKKHPLIRVGGELINFWMRYVDYTSAQNPDVLIANSKTTQQRIGKYYRRESVVVPPPVALVDKQLQVASGSQRSYALFVGRLAVSKHPELAVQVCNELKIPLKVVGTGALLESMKAKADDSVKFLGAVDDAQLAALYQHARLVLFPAEDEDFGIVPIEAMSVGTPVVAHYSGEPRYTVIDGKTGMHVHDLTVDSWKKVTQVAWELEWDYAAIRQSVQRYSEEQFQKELQNFLL